MSFIDNFVRLSNNESFSGGSSYFTANNIDVASRNMGQGVRIMAQATIISPSASTNSTFAVNIVGSYYPIDRTTSIPSYSLITNGSTSATLSYTPSASLIQIPDNTRVKASASLGAGWTNNADYYVRNSKNGSFQLSSIPGGVAISNFTVDGESVAPQYEIIGSSGSRPYASSLNLGKARIVAVCNSTPVYSAPMPYRYLAVQLVSTLGGAFTATVDIIIGHQEGFRNYKSGFDIV